jgi:RNA polymerase sigma-70 factor (ECF subfamily)
MGASLNAGAPAPQRDATAPAPGGAFAEAVSRQRPYLVRFARARLYDDALAEDMVQDTLVAALQRGDAFRRQASLRTWLTAILLRRIADGMRRQRRWVPLADDGAAPTDDDDRASDVGVATGAEAIDWMDPQRRVESRQLLDALGRSLTALAPTAARLLALREFDGLGNDAAARLLGLSPGKATLLLHRTRARLRRSLADPVHAPSRGARAAAAHVR